MEINEQSLKFLLGWFERFPQYKGRGFFISGESYGDGNDVFGMSELGPWALFVNIQEGIFSRGVVGFSARGRVLVVVNCNAVVSPAAEDAHVIKYVPASPEFDLTPRLALYKESLFLLEEGDDLPFLPS